MDQPLTIEVVDEALALVGVRGVTRSDAARTATFGPWVEAPSFRVTVIVPDNSPVLVVRAQPGVGFLPEDRPELLVACNAWHGQHRWPRLTIVDRGGVLMIESDVQVPCPAGLDVDQTAAIIASFVAATHEFWTHMTTGVNPIDGILAGAAELLDTVD